MLPSLGQGLDKIIFARCGKKSEKLFEGVGRVERECHNGTQSIRKDSKSFFGGDKIGLLVWLTDPSLVI